MSVPPAVPVAVLDSSVLVPLWPRIVLHTYGGVEYVTAIEFIEDVLGERADEVYGRPLPGDGALARSHRTG